MKIKNKISGGVKTNKTKAAAFLVATFMMFFLTYFALGANQSQTSNSLFLDSDQDGLTDQEEKMIGTDPMKADTDGDGYSDGAEVQSGYNPLKPSPGDKLTPASSSSPTAGSAANSAQADALGKILGTTAGSSSTDPTNADASQTSLLDSLSNGSLDQATLDSLTSDPSNPNLTNEMIGSFLNMTVDKSQNDPNFDSDPTFSADDISQIVNNSLAVTDISKDMPQIADSDLKILPPVDDKNLSADEKKAEEKEQIQKYLASTAYIFATNSPFPVTDEGSFTANLQTEQDAILAAMTTGDQTKINAYSQKAQAAIDQIKQVEVPSVLVDVHKSALQLALYTLQYKDKIAVDPADPMKGLAAVSSLQAVAEQAMKLQAEISNVLANYGIETIDLSQ